MQQEDRDRDNSFGGAVAPDTRSLPHRDSRGSCVFAMDGSSETCALRLCLARSAVRQISTDLDPATQTRFGLGERFRYFRILITRLISVAEKSCSMASRSTTFPQPLAQADTSLLSQRTTRMLPKVVTQ
jgi:hypothetical protein